MLLTSFWCLYCRLWTFLMFLFMTLSRQLLDGLQIINLCCKQGCLNCHRGEYNTHCHCLVTSFCFIVLLWEAFDLNLNVEFLINLSTQNYLVDKLFTMFSFSTSLDFAQLNPPSPPLLLKGGGVGPYKLEKEGLIQKWGVSTFLLLYNSITFTACVCEK